eukprot:CAMPEP_0175737780 /NCGR_PEP_ID=MMETSP0097-20121207/54132_1 /TAXON_ID=311494 /ORGANISM="Alexandrium monilatum, Strain CCMP3105" /LENGTH=77 /DNA_ID=CAMNT_0017045957 /DNA_START=29 /DNA_END=259 /DNA_ORIENTATION=+
MKACGIFPKLPAIRHWTGSRKARHLFVGHGHHLGVASAKKTCGTETIASQRCLICGPPKVDSMLAVAWSQLTLENIS